MKDGAGSVSSTPNKPQKKIGGKGKLKGIEGGIPFGHPDNPQPSREAKVLGHLKKKTGMELARALLEMSFNDIEADSNLKQRVADFYKIPVEEVNVQLVMHFKQIEKVATTGDTYAYQAFLNRALGMPKQVTEEIGNRTVINVNIEGENEPVIPIQGKVVNGG
jgi:hypothetical protein